MSIHGKHPQLEGGAHWPPARPSPSTKPPPQPTQAGADGPDDKGGGTTHAPAAVPKRR